MTVGLLKRNRFRNIVLAVIAIIIVSLAIFMPRLIETNRDKAAITKLIEVHCPACHIQSIYVDETPQPGGVKHAVAIIEGTRHKTVMPTASSISPGDRADLLEIYAAVHRKQVGENISDDNAAVSIETFNEMIQPRIIELAGIEKHQKPLWVCLSWRN